METDGEGTRIITEEEKTEAKNFNIFDLPDVPTGLPLHLELQRTRVVCNFDAPIHTTGVNYSGAYASMGVDNSVKLENFSENFKVDVISLTETDMVFDMIGVPAGIANAFRRILLSELPSMAIEKVFVGNNTSVIQDEVLAHRMGLIPIAADPRLFEYLSENDQPNEKNTIVFKLHVKCPKGDQRRKVLTNELIWLPNGSELVKESGGSNTKAKTYTSFNRSQDSFPEFAKNPIMPSFQDILIAKLGPGQEIELEAHAVKGIGKTHAKWSPVATAWYRMLPEVILLKEFEGKHAEELVKVCPKKVFDIEDMGQGKKRATVARPRDCSLCRECLRGGEEAKGKRDWVDQVALRRVKNHFIFTIESTGSLPPDVLFTEAVKILEDKCERSGKQNSATKLLDGKIYVTGGCYNDYNPSNWMEVFDIKNKTWEPMLCPAGTLSLYRCYGRDQTNNIVVDGKLYIIGEYKGVAYNPKDGRWNSLGSVMDLPRKWSSCVIENVLYYYYYQEGIKWYDTKVRPWRTLNGMKKLPKFSRHANVRLADYGGKMALFWDKVVASGGGGFQNRMIWCAMIALEKRDSEETWETVEWFDAVLPHPIPVEYVFEHVVAVNV